MKNSAKPVWGYEKSRAHFVGPLEFNLKIIFSKFAIDEYCALMLAIRTIVTPELE